MKPKSDDTPLELRTYRTRKRYAQKEAARNNDAENWKAYMVRPPGERARLPPAQAATVRAQRHDRVRRMDEAIRIGLARRAGITPLEFLLSCLRDPQVRFAWKLDAAKAAAPYMHKRMPIAIHTQTPEGTISLQSAALHRLSSEELLHLRNLLVKAGVGEPEFIGPDPARYAALSPPITDGTSKSEPFTVEGTITGNPNAETQQVDDTPEISNIPNAGSSQDAAGTPSGHDNTPHEASPAAQETPRLRVSETMAMPARASPTITTAQALQAAREAGAITEGPLRLPSDDAPDLDLLPDEDDDTEEHPDDQGTEPQIPDALPEPQKGNGDGRIINPDGTPVKGFVRTAPVIGTETIRRRRKQRESSVRRHRADRGVAVAERKATVSGRKRAGGGRKKKSNGAS